MALLHADGFDHWGTMANAALFNYLDKGTSTRVTVVSTTSPRTGAYSMRCSGGANNGQGAGFYYRLGGTRTNMGAGFALLTASFPAANNTTGFGFLDNADGNQVTFTIGLAGEIIARTGGQTGTIIGTSAIGAIVLGSFSYIECKVVAGVTTGALEVRVNGVQVLVVTGANTGGNYSGFGFGKFGTNGTSPEMYIDDFVLFDDTTADNNDFLGDRRCFTSFPTADTVEADWTPSTGTDGFAMIDEVPPSDVDYIEAATAGDISEFEKTPIGISTNDIAGVVLFSRALKTDAGTSTFRMGIHSGSFVTNGPEIVPGTAFAYFREIIPLNPDGAIPWTRTALDAAFARLTREQ